MSSQKTVLATWLVSVLQQFEAQGIATEQLGDGVWMQDAWQTLRRHFIKTGKESCSFRHSTNEAWGRIKTGEQTRKAGTTQVGTKSLEGPRLTAQVY